MKVKNKKPTKKKVNSLLTKQLPTKKTNAYYHCLAQKATTGLKTGLTKSCQDCKEQSPNLALQRTKQIKKVANAYKSLGLTLHKLLTN